MKPNSLEIEQRIIDIIAKHFGKSAVEVSLNQDFFKDYKADSLEIVSLMIELEENFNFLIEDNEVSKMKTVQGAIDFVHSKLAVESSNAISLAEI